VRKLGKDIKAPNSYFTGNIGELSVNLMYLKNSIVCTPLGTSDFGEDLLCDIFSCSKERKASIRTQFSFRTQVKTTEVIKKDGYIRQISNGFSISLSTGHIKLWQQSFYPIILVIWESSNNIGYWCFPTEQIEVTNLLENDTFSILVKSDNTFDDKGIQSIKEKVESYYNNIYKIEKAKYQCNIYPVWMPKYRLFTSMETLSIMNNNTKMKLIYHIADMLPAFLSSYRNCNHGGLISGIEYSTESQPLEKFWEGVNNFINEIGLTLPNDEWVAFIISPVKIISEFDDRCISNLTDWVSFSLLDNNVISDFSYTFGLKSEYTYSEKVRAASDDQDLFIHSSGDFAVEVFSSGFSFFTRKADFELMFTLQSKSFCIIDISQCTLIEVDAVADWCDGNNYRFIKLNEDEGKFIISHMFFDISNIGAFLPGILTWRDWDNLNFDSKEFLDNIPYGNPVEPKEKKKIFNKYFQQDEQLFELCMLRYSQTLYSEALNHNDRLIRLITYIEPINMNEYENIFKIAYLNLKEVCEHFELYYELYEDFVDIILDIRPLLTQSTQQVIDKVEKIYHDLIVSLKENNDKQQNMAYYVKYCLDRWLPESLVGER
jgi:hypothetical protein